MFSNTQIARWLPLTLLLALAAAFEPIRSGFVWANQPCEMTTDWPRVLGSVFNLRHIVGNGLICLVAASTFRKNPNLNAAIFTFVFSILMEIEQSFFITGHCRSWDLIPNLIGIALALAVFWMVKACWSRLPGKKASLDRE